MKNNLYIFRIKRIFRDKLTCIILAFSLLLFIFVIHSLSLGALEKSNIPIGIVNSDNSSSANELVTNVKRVPAFYTYEGDIKTLKKLLYEEKINAVFVIEKGYEKLIQSGQTKDLITMYYLEDKGGTKILSDIVAGEMLYKICLYKGYKLYHALPHEKTNTIKSGEDKTNARELSEQEYKEYSQKLIESPDFNFAFDISTIYVGENETTSNKLSNSMIYQQVTWGILGFLLSFITMLLTVSLVIDNEIGINKRVKLSLLRISRIEISHLGVILTVLSFFSLLSCIVIGKKVANFTWIRGFELYFLVILYCLDMGLWFIFLGKIIKRVGIYQYVGVISILFMGVSGFFYIIQGFFTSSLLNIFKIIPNSWFIQGFTDIILNGNLHDIPFESHLKLLITAICLGVLNLFVGMKQNN